MGNVFIEARPSDREQPPPLRSAKVHHFGHSLLVHANTRTFQARSS